MRLLLCEDDDQLARGLARALRRAGHEVTRVIGVADALQRLRDDDLPDIALVDLTLPDGHGSQVVLELRKQEDIGIIIITAHGDERSRVLGLRAGADDYVVKPFGVAELLARVDAVGRRTAALRDHRPHAAISVGAYHLDTSERVLSGRNTEVRLTRKECAVLALLAARPDTVIPRSRILGEIWPESPERASRSLDTHIGALRTKLPPGLHVETVHGTGYLLRTGEESQVQDRPE